MPACLKFILGVRGGNYKLKLTFRSRKKAVNILLMFGTRTSPPRKKGSVFCPDGSNLFEVKIALTQLFRPVSRTLIKTTKREENPRTSPRETNAHVGLLEEKLFEFGLIDSRLPGTWCGSFLARKRFRGIMFAFQFSPRFSAPRSRSIFILPRWQARNFTKQKPSDLVGYRSHVARKLTDLKIVHTKAVRLYKTPIKLYWSSWDLLP